MAGPDGDAGPRTRRFPLAALGAFALIVVGTGWDPPSGRLNWVLELGPMVALVGVLAALWRRMPLSDLTCGAIVAHAGVVAYGGYWTYAATPLGNWLREALDLQRNPYDRIGHLALGFFPALLAREILLRCTPLRPGGWLSFLAGSAVFSVGAAWEILEWWTVLVAAPDVGQAYLGIQGDVWDAQWDMLLVGIGAAASLLLLSRLHDRSMSRVMPEGSGTPTLGKLT